MERGIHLANKNKIKLTRNKEGLGGPQYSVTYKVNPRRCVSHAILSALVGDRDVVMVMNTDLTFGLAGKEQQDFEEFLQGVKERGLVYANRTVPSNKQVTIFGLVLSKTKKKKEDAQEIAVYVPNAVWRQEDFGRCLPTCGVQYYIAEAPMDQTENIQAILDMPEEERAEAFVMDVYDIAQLGQIGINARTMGEEDLRTLLGI